MLNRSPQSSSSSVVFHRGVVCRPSDRCGGGATPRSPIIVFALGLALITVLALSLVSCASTREGIEREEAIYTVATNTVATVAPVITAAPPPVNYFGEAIVGLISAGLAAWNLSQQKRLKDLEAITRCTNFVPVDPAAAKAVPVAVSGAAS